MTSEPELERKILVYLEQAHNPCHEDLIIWEAGGGNPYLEYRVRQTLSALVSEGRIRKVGEKRYERHDKKYMTNIADTVWAIHQDRNEASETFYTTLGYIAVRTELPQFVHEMQVGDLVLTEGSASNRDRGDIGRITGGSQYFRRDQPSPILNADFPYMRRVEWLMSLQISRLSAAAQRCMNQPGTITRIVDAADEIRAAVAHMR